MSLFAAIAGEFWKTLFGIPLPLCSCSVIPVVASLRRHGSSRGATTSFLLSTPQTGVDSIMVTFSLLGPVFAVFRPVAAFLTGIVGGAVVEALDSDRTDEASMIPCCEECCNPTQKEIRLVRALRYGFIILPKDIGRPLLIGLLVAGVITALVPANFFSDVIGTGIGAMVVMMVLGIPVYWMLPQGIKIFSAVVLLVILGVAVFVPHKKY